jgi:hypothetical protein
VEPLGRLAKKCLQVELTYVQRYLGGLRGAQVSLGLSVVFTEGGMAWGEWAGLCSGARCGYTLGRDLGANLHFTVFSRHDFGQII